MIILALIVGIAMGYWLADIIRIRDLKNQNAELKARIIDLIEYYENKEESEK